MSNKVIGETRRDKFRLGGKEHHDLLVRLWSVVDDLPCQANYLAKTLGAECREENCCKGQWESKNKTIVEVFCSLAVGWCVCPIWLERHLPDIYYELHPESLAPLKLNLRVPDLGNQCDRYAPLEGCVDGADSLAKISAEIGDLFLRELALAQRRPIEEIREEAKRQSRQLLEPRIVDAGDEVPIPWWIRKGFTERPMWHDTY